MILMDWEKPLSKMEFELVAWKLSGLGSEVREFGARLLSSSQVVDESVQTGPMSTIGESSVAGVLNGASIPY